MKSKILIVEDDPDGARSITEAAEDAGFEVMLAMSGREGVDKFRNDPTDLVLSDLVLPDVDGIEVMRQIRGIAPEVPVLIMTAYGSVESSVNAMHAGAYDYVTKPLDLDEIQSKLRRAAETGQLRRQVGRLSATVRDRFTATAMVANSPAMRNVLRQIEALADTSATVMIQGESGVGKELVARALHVDSQRASAPFVAVNCGAFNESLLESELFGHEKGAFTGATSRHAGAFERADGGTLFLDEIGDAQASVQVKLLRALEEREIRRVGGSESFKVNVRLISASNRDLQEMIADGTFREDLFYRVNVVNITLPPLRHRREDIRPLADRFIANAMHEHKRQINNVESAFYERLEKYEWPGNIRQLRNVVESAVLLCHDQTLRAAALNLPDNLSGNLENNRHVTFPPGMTLAEIEKAVLEQSLTLYQGNRTLTAEKLGLSRRTIQRKIKEHQLPF